MTAPVGTAIARLSRKGKKRREAMMRARVMLLFDTAVLLGFGLYMVFTVWRLPGELRQQLLATSLHVLARLTGLAG